MFNIENKLKIKLQTYTNSKVNIGQVYEKL